MGQLAAINRSLQGELRRRQLDEVPVVEAARWLDAVGLLADSESRPWLPLRNLCRDRAVTRPSSAQSSLTAVEEEIWRRRVRSPVARHPGRRGLDARA